MNDFPQLDEVERELVDKVVALELVSDARRDAAFKLLFGQAKDCAIKARNGLVAVDPEDAKEIRRLQNEVKRYEEMAEWIRTALTKSEQAFRQLSAYRGEAPEQPVDED